MGRSYLTWKSTQPVHPHVQRSRPTARHSTKQEALGSEVALCLPAQLASQLPFTRRSLQARHPCSPLALPPSQLPPSSSPLCSSQSLLDTRVAGEGEGERPGRVRKKIGTPFLWL